MQQPSLHEDDWEYGADLVARGSGGIRTPDERLDPLPEYPRCRFVDAGALAYALSDLSLKDVAAWASALHLAEITGPGLFYWLRQAEPWLEQVLGQILSEQVPQAAGGFRLRVVDATVINGPGQKAVQWRAQVSIHPTTGGIRAVELTEDSGGEKFGRHWFGAGDVVLGDRGYATARGVYAVRQPEAHVVVRFNPVTWRTGDEKRRRIYLAEKEAEIPKVGAVELKITIPVPPPATASHKTWDSAKAIAWIPARAVAARTRTGEVTWLLTTLASKQMPAIGILGLYRVRWQIELLFQRLKALVHWDALPSREGPTAKSWMLARLIAAALAQRLVQPCGPLSPWGYALPGTGQVSEEAQEPPHA
jgi:hypothetical protein